MLSVTYYRRRNCEVILEGHAGSGEAGRDLVCASASILAYTLAANLKRAEAAKCVESVEIHLSPGDARIGCRAAPPAAVSVFDAVCIGFELLADQHPEYISYQVKN